MGGWARNRSELLAHLNRTTLLPTSARARLCTDETVKMHRPTIATLRKIHKTSCWRDTVLADPFNPPGCSSGNMDLYLRDALSFYYGRGRNHSGEVLQRAFGAPVLSAIWEMGDTGGGPVSFPVIMKTRAAPKREHANQTILRPILWKLNNGRHYDWLNHLKRYQQTAWGDKKDVLVFRGATTGNRCTVVQRMLPQVQGRKDMDIGFSILVQRSQNEVACKAFEKGSKSPEELLRNKYILILPGNDIASGLKWSLYSNSVVFMSAPKVVSWGMEDWLIPYRHYVPLSEDYSDLASQLDWAKAHQAEARNIATESTSFILGLFVSKKAKENNAEIEKRMRERYHSLFAEEMHTFCNAST